MNKPPLDLDVIQREMRDWQDRNFPDNTDIENFLGIVEEVGELSHSILKGRQGIRGTIEEHEAKAKDAVGDIGVFLINYCNKKDWSLNDILTETWDTVKRRDWQKNKQDGGVIVVHVHEGATLVVCPVCKHPISPDQSVRVQGVTVHLACAGTYARGNK